jgi:hypothetical protein
LSPDLDRTCIGRWQAIYCERNDFPNRACSEFVRTAVLPQLGKRSESAVKRKELKQRLAVCLEQFRSDEPTCVAFDYRGDWDLFCDALDTAVPEWICGANVRHQISDLLVQQYFKDTGLCLHHALHDATRQPFRLFA